MRFLGIVLFFLAAAPAVWAQQFELPSGALTDDAALARAMPVLAGQVAAAYQDSDRDTYLDNLFRLQLVAGRYAEAGKTLEALRELRRSAATAPPDFSTIKYEIYAGAKAGQAADGQAFDQAFKQSFRQTFAGLDDIAASRVIDSFGSKLDPYGPRLDQMRADLRQALDRQNGRTSIALADALDLLRKYQVEQAFESFQPLADGLIAEDDQRRYLIQDDLLVRTADGASIAVMIVRPRGASAPLPALMGFTIYANPVWSMSEARLTAAHGYAGVVAYTRGKGRSPDLPVPIEHDGADADAVIDWICKQDWSDGRVGMYGGSYNGFTQWAAAKHLPRGLKAIMPSVTVAPGIDWPMEGNIFENFVYAWLPYTLDNKTLDQEHYDDEAHWTELNRTWYSSGQAYRALDRIDGVPNPIFQRWLDHPDYDAYWQAMIPYRREFAAINIPVLTTTGYYDGSQIGALYYFTEHYKYNPHADHYLLIGPYNHIGAQRSAWDVLRGYKIDPVANIDIGHVLRYQWFDYVLRGGPRPPLLQDKVNYEVMGANQWKHAPSLQRMSDGRMRFYLSDEHSGEQYRLSPHKPAAQTAIAQQVDFADRRDVDDSSPGLLLDKTLDRRNGLVFAGDAFVQDTEISGLFSGQLDFIVNKRDMDLGVTLYEQLPDGRYFRLSYYQARASYIRDRSHRQLLIANQRQRLAFRSGRLTSVKFPAGSRLVVVLSILKQPDLQINYGTGKSVSDETIADAAAPLRIRWFGDSHVDVPVAK